MSEVEIRHFHLFAGLGGGARGFNQGHARVGSMRARFRCIGGVDVDAAAMRDFERLAGTGGTVLDLFDRDSFRDFHGSEPPAHWREATAADIRRAAGNESPNIVFLSPPCKGYSGLLSARRSVTPKYQALNRLTLRGVWLMLEAFADEPPELIVFENVPRISNRGRDLLDRIGELLRAYGYAVAETTHDCGEMGALAQSRKRFLLVARHLEKVPPFLYEPQKKRLRAVGEVLGRMPLPGDPSGGPMHRVARLHWKTWVRLAFVEAGRDWRSLNRLAVENGVLRDYLIVPEVRNGTVGVVPWACAAGTVTGNARPMAGAFSVADPRFAATGEYGQLGVRGWNETTGTVTGQRSPIQGGFSVADPRHSGPAKHSNEFRIVPWERETGAVTGAHGTGQCVADPRPGLERGRGDPYLTAGHYGVTRWDDASGAVSSAAAHDNGRWSVADPRMPQASDKLIAVIRALDGTWHRPFTTLELAALQSLVDPEEYLELDGLSDTDWRERIGNAVPPHAAAAIAGVMGTTLLLARAGEAFMLSCAPIWVRPVAVALSVDQAAP